MKCPVLLGYRNKVNPQAYKLSLWGYFDLCGYEIPAKVNNK